MGNCLKTQLKQEVNNENLPKLNSIRLKIVGNTSTATGINQIMIWTHSSTSKVTPGGGGGISLTNGNFSTDAITLSPNSQNIIYVENTDFYLDIDDKYNIYAIRNGASRSDCIVGGNVEQFEFIKDDELLMFILAGRAWEGDIQGLKNATNVSIDGTNISGNIDIFAGKTFSGSGSQMSLTSCPNITGNIGSLAGVNATTLDVRYSTNIAGNIAGLGSNTSLTTIHVRDTKVSGSIDALASAILTTLPSKSGTLAITGNGIITYKANGDGTGEDTVIASGVVKTITFNGAGGYTIA